MGVSHVTPDGSGGYWGWDDSAGDWVPVDPQAYEGSTVGNLARGAGRGFRDIGLGVEQLAGIDTPGAVEASQAQGAAAAAGAPIAEMFGGSAPDALAGIVGGSLTGGAGLAAGLAAATLSGAGTAAIRPGSVEERLNAALWGGIAGLGGEGLSMAAVKGVGLALKLGKGIIDRGAETTARAVDTGVQRAGMREMIEGATADPRLGGPPGAAGAGPEPQPGGMPGGGGSTAGAEQVRNAETAQMGVEGDIIEQSMGYGDRGVGDNKAGRIYGNAGEHGYQAPGFQGAPRGSKAMVNAAIEEFNPMASSAEEARRIGNAQLLNRSFAKAAGMTTDLNDANFNQIDLSDFARMQEHLATGFEEVEKEMPKIPYKSIQKELAKIPDREGLVAGTKGEEVLRELKHKLSQKVMASDGNAGQEPGGFIRDLRMIQAHALRAAKEGDQESAGLLNQAVNLYYKVAETTTAQTPSKYGAHGRDSGIVGKGWKQLRDEYRMVLMGSARGSWGADGTINARSILNQMTKQPINGGYGAKGPPTDSAARALWDVAQAAAHEQTALGRTPATGVRLAKDIGKIARNTALAGVGLAGVNGIANNLWD